MKHVMKVGMKFARIVALGLTLSLCACAPSTHPTQAARMGKAISSVQMEALLDSPGELELETINSADWQVDLSGLLNLEHPKAVAAGLRNRDEPIQIFAHVVHHPLHGYFLIDTGVSEKVAKHPEEAGVSWLMRQGMHLEKMKLHRSTANIIQSLPQALSGVWLSHLHIDHISGMPDIAANVPVYAGPHETEERHWLNAFARSTTDRLLENKSPLQIWQFKPDVTARTASLDGVIDIFGDGSAFALHVPGHTAGSVAYVLRTKQGAVLLTGDTSHTRWGWDNGVEPGDFTRHHPNNRASLEKLKALVARHPGMQVRFGHQS